MRRSFSVVILLAAAIIVAGFTSTRYSDSRRLSTGKDPNGVIVHEWGTFTSVAAEDGSAVEWIPRQGPSDLPCFVDRARLEPKSWLQAMIRMETPVLYFYSPQEATLDVRVRFRRGVITEWYPRADVSPMDVKAEMLRNPDLEGSISWPQVKVQPRALEEFPTDASTNHYYAARATDAAPLQVGSQREKFLFYRGIANFASPLSATIAADGRITVKANGGESVGDVILFENRGGRMAHQVRRDRTSQVTMQPSPLVRSNGSVRKDLERLLVAHGLYEKEARAMVETWRDSWFEEGSRLFYILPQRTVDSILPLDITPAPAAVARVFVGRLELLTPATVDEVEIGLAKQDRSVLLKHQRFLVPILRRIHGSDEAARIRDWQFVVNAVTPRMRGCR